MIKYVRGIRVKQRLNKLPQSKKDEIALSIWDENGKKVKAIAAKHKVSVTTVHLILHEYFRWELVRK